MSSFPPARLRLDADQQGRRAYQGGYQLADNPYPPGTVQHDGFRHGYRDAQRLNAPKVAEHLQAPTRRQA